MPSRNGKTEEDAIALLIDDHETVRDLLAEMDDTTMRAAKKRTEILTKIARAVRIHSRIEQEIFYPAFKDAAKSQEDRKLFFEATEEHGLVDIVLPALEDEDPASDAFGAKAKVLKDLIEHHADEEEDEMFPRAKQLLGRDRLMELGEEIRMRKEELSTEMGEPRSVHAAHAREIASR